MSLHILFIILLGILTIVAFLIVAVLLLSFSKFKSNLHEQLWGRIIAEKIAHTVIEGVKNTPENTLFEQRIQNVRFKNLFLEKLVEAERKFTGSANVELKLLYKNYHLDQVSLKKLSQKKNHLIGGAIQELTSMQVEEALPRINTFLNHPSPMIYQEAQYASVHFKGFEGLFFLSVHHAAMSDWHQLKLLLSIKELPENAMTQMKIWLESSNFSVTIFTLRLIRKFKFLPAEEHVKTLLNHSSTRVRTEAVRILHALENSKTNTILIESYSDQPVEVQREIMKMLLLSKDARCTDFFKTELLNHPDIPIKISAAESLLSLGHKDELCRYANDRAANLDIKNIINHVIKKK